jgi:hypothetical protein
MDTNRAPFHTPLPGVKPVADEITPGRTTNNAAIRLWQLDMAMQHLTRQTGMLGLGANAVMQSLRTERHETAERLKVLGETMVDRKAG